jgi:hypothetical protein
MGVAFQAGDFVELCQVVGNESAEDVVGSHENPPSPENPPLPPLERGGFKECSGPIKLDTF